MSLVIAVIASAAIVLVAPFMGQLQSFLRRSLSTRNYVLLFGVGVLVAVAVAVAMAVRGIRDRRGPRFALLAVALLIGGGYLWATGTPYPEVNAVERVHFVEYGLIAFLFYRAYRHAGDLSVLILPLLAGFIAGTLDEWLQWFVPGRVGEAHDVLLNLVSLVCGVMFAVALNPPSTLSMTLAPASVKRVGLVAATAWVVFATFFSQVHLGYAHDIAGLGRFHSHYTEAELRQLSADRVKRWRTNPPTTLRRLSQEDQYLDEGLWHVRRRNLTGEGEAWRENLILERFYAPVLDTPTYASPNGSRWAAEQRVNMEAHAGDPSTPFVSDADPYPIVTWPRSIYWPIVGVVAMMIAFGSRRIATYPKG